MATQNTTLYNPLSDSGLMSFIREVQSDKDFNSLVVDCLVNMNKVFPAGYPYIECFVGEMLNSVRKTGAFTKYIDLMKKYKDSLSKQCDWRSSLLSESLYESKKFLVCEHCIFFHGTSFESYEQILRTGYLKFTDYLKGIDQEKTDNALLKFSSFATGNVFLTDDFGVASKYAIKRNTKGVILCLDLYGLWLEYLHERNDRNFISKQEITLDRLKKAYSIEVIDNQIMVDELEVMR